MDEQRRARMGLCALNKVADPHLAALLERYEPTEVWEAVRSQEETALGRRARTLDLAAIEAETERAGARFLIPGDAEWPVELDELSAIRLGDMGGAPFGLWLRGRCPVPNPKRSVAVVGARAATGYGLHVAADLAAGLAEAGWAVISGLAFGIDSAAHRGALAVRGQSIAVMANGIDHTYPASHADLRAQIEATGAVLTESPPGSRPMRASFLARNRLIAALGMGTVIVEASARSGARNTASWCGELGRLLMAIPGPVTSSMSVATHQLIRDQAATLITSAEEALALLEPLGSVPETMLSGADRPIDRLPERLRLVREAVPARGAVGAGELAVTTGLTVPQVLAAASELVEFGWLDEVPEGWRLPRR